jgi:hypothetical protein
VLSSPTAKFAPLTGPYALYFDATPAIDSGSRGYSVSLENILIPAGPIRCDMRAKITQNNSPPYTNKVYIGLSINGISLSSYVLASETEWMQIGGLYTSRGGLNNIKVLITFPGTPADKSWTVGLDDLVCVTQCTI